MSSIYTDAGPWPVFATVRGADRARRADCQDPGPDGTAEMSRPGLQNLKTAVITEDDGPGNLRQ